MKVTYIGHSGFLVEWDECYWLFDYYTGDIPPMDAAKKVYVFVSHGHGDHYNPKIFELRQKHRDIEYVLSSDIRPPEEDWARKQVLSVEPEKQYELHDGDSWGDGGGGHGDGFHNGIMLTTLRSTDLGVAFLLTYQGKTVYHAGDLNYWIWEEETDQYNDVMANAFKEQMAHLRGKTIDVAFVPLDPRQEGYYYLGLETLLNTAKVKHVFPMHFGAEFSVIGRYKSERPEDPCGATVVDIERAGQEWKIEP